MLFLPVYWHVVLHNKPPSKPVDQNSSHLLLNCVSQEAPGRLGWAGLIWVGLGLVLAAVGSMVVSRSYQSLWG